MKVNYCASLMCAKMDNLNDEIRDLSNSGIDRFHLDVMDGVFVPNFALGIQDIEAVCRLSDIKCEAHLMIMHPSKYVQKFVDLGVDIIYVHPEADYHPSATLQQIINAGAEPGIVIDPDTSIETIKELFHIVKYVLVMTVSPGFAGQSFLPFVERKLESLVSLKQEYNFEIELDGGCTFQTIDKYYKKGVDSFVLGTNTLFKEKEPYFETIRKLNVLLGLSSVNSPPQNNKHIRMLIMDVDGTLTDGKIYMGDDNEVLKAFNIKDGYAINEILPLHGITPVWITGRQSQIVKNRAKELNVDLIYQNVKDKSILLEKIVEDHGIPFDEIAYIGDDMIDYECMRKVGLSGCPNDAVIEVKRIANYVTKSNAGKGAVREFIEWLIKRN